MLLLAIIVTLLALACSVRLMTKGDKNTEGLGIIIIGLDFLTIIAILYFNV